MLTAVRFVENLELRSFVKPFCLPHLTKKSLHTYSTLKMRELLLPESKKSIEIPEKKSGTTNDYIKNILGSDPRKISIELSPNSLFEADLLEEIGTCFVSVTWLGNMYTNLPAEEVPPIKLAKQLADCGYSVLLHLAGRNIDRSRMLIFLTYLKNVGIKNILALQGDKTHYWPHVSEKDDSKCEFPYASDLVLFIKENFGDSFSVGVAAYPKIHPHAKNLDDDMKHLKLKIDNGADFIITQVDFECTSLENFVMECRKNGINVPVLPGVLVIKSYNALVNMAKWCEFQVPANIFEYVRTNREHPDVVEEYGLDLAVNLMRSYLGNSELFAGVHVFSMNDISKVKKLLCKLYM